MKNRKPQRVRGKREYERKGDYTAGIPPAYVGKTQQSAQRVAVG